MKPTKMKQQRDSLKRNEEKWGAPLMAAGWTAFPSVILERQQGLGLDAVDINIILHLARHWWFSGNLPHPSKRTIAECMGIDPSTVRRHIAAMERDGLITRRRRFSGGDRRQQTNEYSFEGLVKAATPFAGETLKTRRARKAEDEKRRLRRRPDLRLVRQAEGEGEDEP
jgi:DNA-binding transcriptional ArsR family regulator